MTVKDEKIKEKLFGLEMAVKWRNAQLMMETFGEIVRNIHIKKIPNWVSATVQVENNLLKIFKEENTQILTNMINAYIMKFSTLDVFSKAIDNIGLNMEKNFQQVVLSNGLESWVTTLIDSATID